MENIDIIIDKMSQKLGVAGTQSEIWSIFIQQQLEDNFEKTKEFFKSNFDVEINKIELDELAKVSNLLFDYYEDQKEEMIELALKEAERLIDNISPADQIDIGQDLSDDVFSISENDMSQYEKDYEHINKFKVYDTISDLLSSNKSNETLSDLTRNIINSTFVKQVKTASSAAELK